MRSILLAASVLVGLATLAPARAADAPCRPVASDGHRGRTGEVTYSLLAHTSGCAFSFGLRDARSVTETTIETQPDSGTLTTSGASTIVYRPEKDFHGDDSFAIRVCSVYQGHSGCATQVYFVTVD